MAREKRRSDAVAGSPQAVDAASTKDKAFVTPGRVLVVTSVMLTFISAWRVAGGDRAHCQRLRDFFGRFRSQTLLSLHFGQHLRLQVCLIHVGPGSAQIAHAQIDNPLTAFQFPCHP